MVCLFENFRNALLFIGFGTGLMGFDDIILTYGRTISLSSLESFFSPESVTTEMARTTEEKAHHPDEPILGEQDRRGYGNAGIQ
mmetsp:Transcript_1385/g.3069  ORF Transcript_1385/g.3069 Transcript_1385/m.3069 type:complete len:84 (+) Transcript_1385:83-334(+)